MSTPEIAIRSIQHYMYCPHRWGLLEIGRVWEENGFVTKANLMHARVHDPDNHYTSRGKKIFTSVPVYHDGEGYNLYGVIDCLELTEDKQGIIISGSEKKYKLCVVEYKPTKPKGEEYHEDDFMQVFAQKLCADYVFECDCTCALYYGDVKKKVSLPVKERFAEYDNRLKSLLKEMRMYLQQGRIPAIRKGQKCSGCSMKDLCMPAVKKIRDLRKEIETLEE
ncbi:Dna2/Cas4 domain-containing protein [Lachnospiraceae bacterium 62-35]